jgi:rubrerythrin
MKVKMDLADAWKMAIRREEEARDLYAELVEMVQEDELKKLFGFLIEQEKHHKRLLEAEFDKHFMQEF